MKYVHDWQGIKRHYESVAPQIMAAGRNEWGVDPYAWESEAKIRLTPIELWLWHDIRAIDMVLYPQYPVRWHFADFANPVAKVVIECDGKAFHEDKAKDAARDQRMQAEGWTVYRFTGSECRIGVGLERESEGSTRQRMLEIGRRHEIIRGAPC